MLCVEKHTLAFKALLCPVVAAESRAIAKLRSTFLENRVGREDTAAKSRKDEFNRLLKIQYRHTIYLAVVSRRFLDALPFIREVDASEHSDYDKLIIIMTVVNIPPGEIANLIESNPQSIKTLQHRHREFIEELKEGLL